jgi:hypothetical protein
VHAQGAGDVRDRQFLNGQLPEPVHASTPPVSHDVTGVPIGFPT